MDVGVFQEAVRSVKEWPGVVAMFGGNPCVHPKFPELVKILCDEIPEQRRRGLWTNNLMKHGDLVRKSFYPNGRFNLNAHCDSDAAKEFDKWLPGKIIETSRRRMSWHSPILLAYNDMGLTYDKWVKYRENCDINRDWSSAIVERTTADGTKKPYVYFCEVAAALDGVRGVNHGIPAEPGWWKWKMDRFSSQVSNCCDVGCGVPLKRLGHKDREDTYDYSPTWARDVEEGAKGRSKLKVVKHLTMPKGTELTTDYQAHRTNKPAMDV